MAGMTNAEPDPSATAEQIRRALRTQALLDRAGGRLLLVSRQDDGEYKVAVIGRWLDIGHNSTKLIGIAAS